MCRYAFCHPASPWIVVFSGDPDEVTSQFVGKVQRYQTDTGEVYTILLIFTDVDTPSLFLYISDDGDVSATAFHPMTVRISRRTMTVFVQPCDDTFWRLKRALEQE
jgi:hypothetical protein